VAAAAMAAPSSRRQRVRADKGRRKTVDFICQWTSRQRRSYRITWKEWFLRIRGSPSGRRCHSRHNAAMSGRQSARSKEIHANSDRLGCSTLQIINIFSLLFLDNE
jgi:hypothetical protein